MADSISIQKLIQDSPDDKERELFIELRVVIPCYGHERQLWDKVLRLMRQLREVDRGIKFFTGKIQLEDSKQ